MKIAYNCKFYLSIKDEIEVDDRDFDFQEFIGAFDELERNLKKYIEVNVTPSNNSDVTVELTELTTQEI